MESRLEIREMTENVTPLIWQAFCVNDYYLKYFENLLKPARFINFHAISSCLRCPASVLFQQTRKQLPYLIFAIVCLPFYFSGWSKSVFDYYWSCLER